MQRTLRPYVTAGVALVGAGAIAVTPVAAPPALPDVHASAVQLSAAASDLAVLNPVTAWADVLQQSSANLTEIFTRASTNPALQRVLQAKLEYYGDQLFGGYPAFLQALGNWATTTLPAGLQTAFEQVIAGEPALATQTVTAAIGGVIWAGMGMSGWLYVPQAVMDDLTATVKSTLTLNTVTDILNGVQLPFYNPFNALGVSAQHVVDAMEAGDPVAALGAIINTPATLANALLNSDGGLLDYRSVAGGRVIMGGIVTSLLVNMPERLAKALPPVPAPAATSMSVTDTSVGGSTMVALNVGAPDAELSASGPAALPAAPVADEDVSESDSATAASDGNKVTPGTVAPTSKLRKTVRPSTALKNIRAGVDNTVSKVADGVKKALGGTKRATTKKSADSKGGASSNAGSGD